MTRKTFPQAYPHGELKELFKDLFFVTGSLKMPGRLPIQFSRNMTVVREADRLTLINSIRLDESGLAALERLGEIKGVVRLAGFHGMDDPFYKDRYGATVWAVKGQPYTTGFNVQASADDDYFKPDIEMDAQTKLPIDRTTLYLFSCRPPEGMLVLEREGGVIVSGDCLQNWRKTDRYFSLPAKLMMKVMGFIKPCNIGPGWLKMAKPDAKEIRGILDLDFEHVLPAHGTAVIGGAKEAYRATIEKLT